jgi:nucleoside-triphosphatase
MEPQYPKTLITGKPGVGKTTLVRKVVERMRRVSMVGFYTSEIRSNEKRSGFELRGISGERRVLAHVNIQSRHRVGRYGVDIAGFEVFLDQLDLLNPGVGLVVIDEIGKMELFSNRFRTMLRAVLDSNRQLIATIALHGGGLIQEIKARPDVHLLEVDRNNRDHLVAEIVGQI